MTGDWWTLLPVHGIATGKSRLAAVLDAEARAVLNRHLLTHTLTVIEAWQGDLARCVVVSPCEDALDGARAAGAHALHEPAGAGLNAALAFAAAVIAARGGAKLLIVACDLPYLSALSLQALTTRACAAGCAAIAPDRSGLGTNALALETGVRNAFHFGANSYALHCEKLARAGYRVASHVCHDLAFDLDTPQDHAEWLAVRDARIPRGIASPVQQPMEEAGQ